MSTNWRGVTKNKSKRKQPSKKMSGLERIHFLQQLPQAMAGAGLECSMPESGEMISAQKFLDVVLGSDSSVCTRQPGKRHFQVPGSLGTDPFLALVWGNSRIGKNY